MFDCDSVDNKVGWRVGEGVTMWILMSGVEVSKALSRANTTSGMIEMGNLRMVPIIRLFSVISNTKISKSSSLEIMDDTTFFETAVMFIEDSNQVLK